MAYERVNWENLPSTNTPVNADNLNKMDEGIEHNGEILSDVLQTATTTSNGLMSASDKSKLDNISYSSFIPTPSSDIEYNQSRVQKYGNIVVVSLSFNLKNTITKNTNIYSNLPSIGNNLYGTIKSYNDNSARAVRIVNGIMCSDEGLSAGWYGGQMTYITN